VAETQIEGQIPLGLRGTLFRNGPGLNDVYGTPLKHPIDGDGYIVRLSFVNGKAHLKSKYVDTFSHVKEREARKMIFPGQMGSVPPEKTTERFRDPSHTNSFYWYGRAALCANADLQRLGPNRPQRAGLRACRGGKVVSCHEYVLPNTLDPTTLETLGSDDLHGALDGIKALSAHFRYDASRDCLITVSFRPGNAKRSSSVRFCEFDRRWRLLRKLDLRLPELNYVHDFVATPTHFVVHVTPFVNVTPEMTARIARGELSLGESMRHYPDLPSKMIVVERFPTGPTPATIEFETEPCHIYHFGTCAQSADQITFDAVCLPPGAHRASRLPPQGAACTSRALACAACRLSYLLGPRLRSAARAELCCAVLCRARLYNGVGAPAVPLQHDGGARHVAPVHGRPDEEEPHARRARLFDGRVPNDEPVPPRRRRRRLRPCTVCVSPSEHGGRRRRIP
jgi:all-trans-8'-apo-beta-carotenal 15,15'-oxygenase